MKLSSLHNHTIFCDGEDDIETMCRSAYEKQLCAVGFSAHAPVPKHTGIKTDWHLSEDMLDEYVSEVISAKNRWRGKIDVLLGLEVDYIKGLRSPNDSDIKSVNADYIIGSVHYVIPPNGADIFTVDGHWDEFEKGLCEGFNEDGEALMQCYYDATIDMILQGGFDILGHADLIKKNCQNKILWNKENELIRQKEIAAASTNIIVEVNTGGLNRKKIDEVYPSKLFLQYFCENNIPVLITADAHCAAHIKGNYDIAINTLKNANFNEHVLFLEKTDNKILWVKEKITS